MGTNKYIMYNQNSWGVSKEATGAGTVNESTNSYVMTVSPYETRQLTAFNFVDEISRNAIVFTRSLNNPDAKGADEDNKRQPQWPVQKEWNWERTRHSKSLRITFSDTDYLEACSIDQLNYFFFETSKTIKYTPQQIHDIYNTWRLAGICRSNEIDDSSRGEGDDRMLNLQMAGRTMLANTFEGDVSPSTHNYIFCALRFYAKESEFDSTEFRISQIPNGLIIGNNTRPADPDTKNKSLLVFPTKDDFAKRLIPQITFATSVNYNPSPKELEYDCMVKGIKVKLEALVYPIGQVLVNRSFQNKGDKTTKTNLCGATYDPNTNLDMEVNLRIFN